MKYLHRCYVRKCRLAAVRKAADRQPRQRRRRRVVKLALGAVVFAALLGNLGMVRRVSDWLKSLIQIRSIQERILPDRYGGPFPGVGEPGEGPVVREGVNIQLDEKAISIFRIRDSREEVND